MKRFQDVGKEIEYSIEIDPEDIESYISLANYYLNEQVAQYQTCHKRFKKIIPRLDINSDRKLAGRIYYSIGFCSYYINEFADTEKYIKNSIEFSDSSDAHNILGIIFEKQGRLKDALGEYNKSLELDPDNSYTQKNLERLNRKLE